MKKFIVLPLVILLLCGCTSQKQTTVVVKNISFTADITYGEQNYIADVTTVDDALNLIVIAPEEIKGFTLNFNKNSVTAQFNGISYTPDINSLPQGAVIQILFQILNDTVGKTIDVRNENCQIKGELDGNEYVFTFSPSGLPISLKINDINFSIEFNNVSLK